MTNRLKALAIVLAMLPVCLPPTPAAAYPSVLEDLTGSVPSNPEAGIQTVSDDERAGGSRAALRQPIRGLLRRLGPLGRLAVAPVDGAGAGSLERERLRREIEAVLADLAGPGQQVISRSALSTAFEEAMTFRDARLSELLAAGEADAIVVPLLDGKLGQGRLSLNVISTRPNDTGRVLAVAKPVPWPPLVASAAPDSLEASLDALSAQLADRLVPTLGGSVPILREHRAGAVRRHAFLEFMSGKIRAGLSVAVERRLSRMPQPLRREGGDAVPSLTVALKAWDHGDTVSVTVRVLKDGTPLALQSIDIASAAIPAHFSPLTARGGAVGAVRHRLAVSRQPAHSSPRLGAGRLTARRALARTLGGEGFDRAFPADEVWLVDRSNVPMLDARLVETAGPAGQWVLASLHARRLIAGEPLRITLEPGRQRVEAAIFALQSDDTVLRLYPDGTGSSIPISPGRTASFPAGGGAIYAAAPPPGAVRAREAVLVVLSDRPFDTDRLAPVPHAAGTGGEAVSAAAFFDALATFGERRFRLTVLEYEVVRRPPPPPVSAPKRSRQSSREFRPWLGLLPARSATSAVPAVDHRFSTVRKTAHVHAYRR